MAWCAQKRWCGNAGVEDVITLSDYKYREVAEKYGVWQEKSRYGRTYMGIARTTYLIGPDGKVRQRWDNVKVNGHVAGVLAAL